MRPDVLIHQPLPPVRVLGAKAGATDLFMLPWLACGFGDGDWAYAARREAADTISAISGGMRCSLLHSVLPSPCADCLGCECQLVAWLRANRVSFGRFDAVPQPEAEWRAQKLHADPDCIDNRTTALVNARWKFAHANPAHPKWWMEPFKIVAALESSLRGEGVTPGEQSTV